MSRYNAPLPAITGNVVQIVVQSVTDGQVYENTFHYMCQTPGFLNSAVLSNLILAFQTAFETAYLGCISPKTSLTQYLAADVSLGFTPTQALAQVGVLGTAGATALPGQVAAVIRRLTAVKGQHGRGRFSMPSVPNTFVTPGTSNNTINATGVTAYGTLRTLLLGTLTASALVFTPVLATRPIAPAQLVTNAGQILSLSLDTILGTVRSRKSGVGI